jgi:hypothetical protein
VDAPTATAKIIANTKHISSLGSAKAIRKKLPIPLLKKKKIVKKSKIKDSMAENKATGDLTSQKKGLKKVATRLLGISVRGFDVLIEKLDPRGAVSERF